MTLEAVYTLYKDAKVLPNYTGGFADLGNEIPNTFETNRPLVTVRQHLPHTSGVWIIENPRGQGEVYASLSGFAVDKKIDSKTHLPLKINYR